MTTVTVKARFEVFLLKPAKEGDLVSCPRCKKAQPVLVISGLPVINCDDHIGILTWLQERDVV